MEHASPSPVIFAIYIWSWVFLASFVLVIRTAESARVETIEEMWHKCSEVKVNQRYSAFHLPLINPNFVKSNSLGASRAGGHGSCLTLFDVEAQWDSAFDSVPVGEGGGRGEIGGGVP